MAGGLGVLGRRLVLAFTVVAATAITLVTVAALVGTDRGLSSQLAEQRRALATNLAASAAQAYDQAGGWADADLDEVRAVVAGTGTQVVVRDVAGAQITVHGMGRRGAGRGVEGAVDSAATLSVPVVSAGSTVGTLSMTFPAETVVAGRPVAWSWVLGAAAAALAMAVAAGVLAARELTRPVLALTAATRTFATGDRAARPSSRGVGELGELADAFDEAASAVQAAEAARRQMAADVAHELRTPLAALQAGLEEVRDGLSPADTPTLTRLHDQALRLGRVVGDLADLSAAEAVGPGLHLERLDLAALAGAECTAREPQIRAADLALTLRASAPAWVRADPHRMHQVVGNLLENCIRHCRPGDRVSVAVTTSDGVVQLEVADTGPGIDAADLPAVLTRFWRSAEARNRSVGSGLGLAIVAELVRAHQGEVTVTSPDHDGTVVRIQIPEALGM